MIQPEAIGFLLPSASPLNLVVTFVNHTFKFLFEKLMDNPFSVALDHQHQTLISIKDPGHSLCKILCKAGNALQSV